MGSPVLGLNGIYVPNIPRWMSSSYPGPTLFSKLFYSTAPDQSNYAYQTLADSFQSIFDRTDTRKTYWTTTCLQLPITVLINGTPVAQGTGLQDGLVFPGPQWFFDQVVTITNGNYISTLVDFSTSFTLPNIDNSYRVYLLSNIGEVIFIDPNQPTWPTTGIFTVWYASTSTCTLLIDGSPWNYSSAEVNDYWDMWSGLYGLNNKYSNTITQGQIQAISQLKDQTSLISSSLFPVQTGFWNGWSTVSASGNTYIDVSDQEYVTIIETPQTNGATIYLNSYPSGLIEVKYDGQTYVYTSAGSNNSITLSPAPVGLVTIKYQKLLYQKSGGNIVTSGSYPLKQTQVFQLQSIDVSQPNLALDTYTWGNEYSGNNAGSFI